MMKDILEYILVYVFIIIAIAVVLTMFGGFLCALWGI